MTELAAQQGYPVRLEVDYPERQSRWTALFRLPLSIPLFIFLYLLGNAVDVAIIAAILVSGRIPRWLFEFRVAASRWIYRAGAYALLLTDNYPPFEGDHAVSYDITYPEKLSRWKLLAWKFITSVPHFFVLAVLALTLVVVVPIGWFAILFMGRFPRGLHGYVTGVLRWSARVSAYAFSLTDEYPPYSLDADAPAATGGAVVASSAVGALAIAGMAAGIVSLIVFVPWGNGEEKVTQVSYERLLAGEIGLGEARLDVNGTQVDLRLANDPSDETLTLITPLPGHRMVTFSFLIKNNKKLGGVEVIDARDFSLLASDGGGKIVVVVAGRRPPPVWLQRGESAAVDVVFELPVGSFPEQVSFSGDEGWTVDRAVFEFR